VSTFSADVYEEFLSKANYDSQLTSLESDIVSVQERFSSPEWRVLFALPEPTQDETPKSTLEASPLPPPPHPETGTTQPATLSWALKAKKLRKKTTPPLAKSAPAAAPP
jgi:hypothetical protein